MSGDCDQSAEWLHREDRVCHEERLARLQWLASAYPSCSYVAFHGGAMSKYLCEEMRYCFVYGQFLATVMLGLAYIEQTLAGKLFGAGRDDMARAGMASLLREAEQASILTEDEVGEINRIRKARNTATHFRRPLHKDCIERRSVMKEAPPYEVLEDDAVAVIQAALSVLGRDGI